MSFEMLASCGFAFGIVLGFFVQRAGFCIAAGLGEIFAGKGKRITSLLLVIFIISSLGFLISSSISNDLGLKTIGHIRGYGFWNLVAGMLFGAGIFLNGGCILGTLRQIGEGNLLFLVVFLSFIPGMALVVFYLNPLLEKGYDIKKVLVSDLVGCNPAYVTAVLCVISIVWLWNLKHKK